jgi:hypothetical protein
MYKIQITKSIPEERLETKKLTGATTAFAVFRRRWNLITTVTHPVPRNTSRVGTELKRKY